MGIERRPVHCRRSLLLARADELLLLANVLALAFQRAQHNDVVCGQLEGARKVACEEY